ncbi:MAG: hypothetical protein ACYCPT_07230 [Acidimicrobiales bacterium]
MALTESSRDRWPDFPFLEASVTLEKEKLEVGGSSGGHVHLRNFGQEAIEFQSDQPIPAAILNPSTMERVGGYSGWIAGTGLMMHLRPGEVATIPVLIGTARRQDDQILALPPGKYLVEVDVPILEQRPDKDGYERSFLHLPLVHLEVVEKRSERN